MQHVTLQKTTCWIISLTFLVGVVSHWHEMGELPRDETIPVICRSGQRAYYATRVLLQNGFKACTISGGMIIMNGDLAGDGNRGLLSGRSTDSLRTNSRRS
jgi:rhodanese-related sulfurtransferase